MSLDSRRLFKRNLKFTNGLLFNKVKQSLVSCLQMKLFSFFLYNGGAGKKQVINKEVIPH